MYFLSIKFPIVRGGERIIKKNALGCSCACYTDQVLEYFKMEDGDVRFHIIPVGFLSGGQGEDSQSKCQSFCVNKLCRLYLWLLHGLIRLICHSEVAGEVISVEVREVIKVKRGFQLLKLQGLGCATVPGHPSLHMELDKEEIWWKRVTRGYSCVGIWEIIHDLQKQNIFFPY